MSSSQWRFAILFVLLLGAGVFVFVLTRVQNEEPSPAEPNPPSLEAPPDPRLTFDTPFRNVKPDVKYVGDAACESCHKEYCDSYHQHPMGRSATTWPTKDRLEQFGPTAHTTFDGKKGARYRAEEKDGRLWHIEQLLDRDGGVLAEIPAEATIVIGSGHQARSYLCIRNGSLWQTGVTWYSSRQRWDLSPGFSPSQHAQRPAFESCLFCHVDRVEPAPGSRMRFQEPIFARQAHIGCERCHGPGELHVRERTEGKLADLRDTSIVNPRHLDADLRDAVCQQCHLQGVQTVPRRGREVFDFRPGLPLELFQAVFVKAASSLHDLEFVGHVQQMASSRCAQESGGRMSCTVCHDPHKDPAPNVREAHFRQGCIKCHADRGCSVPIAERKAKNDNCAACHMPRRSSGDISHTSVSDHRILRKPEFARKQAGIRDGDLPIMFYHAKSRFAPSAEEQERDLGIALAQVVRVNRALGERDPYLVNATAARLKRSSERFPLDDAVWDALAVVHGEEGQSSEALAALERALTIQPRNEAVLSQAAIIALQLNETAKAMDLAKRAKDVNPGNSMSRLLYGMACVEAGKWAEAEADLRSGLEELPSNVRARAALAVCLFRKGHARASEAELARAITFAPDQERSLREWVHRRTR